MERDIEEHDYHSDDDDSDEEGENIYAARKRDEIAAFLGIPSDDEELEE